MNPLEGNQIIVLLRDFHRRELQCHNFWNSLQEIYECLQCIKIANILQIRAMLCSASLDGNYRFLQSTYFIQSHYCEPRQKTVILKARKQYLSSSYNIVKLILSESMQQQLQPSRRKSINFLKLGYERKLVNISEELYMGSNTAFSCIWCFSDSPRNPILKQPIKNGTLGFYL